jgi:hypothetical protein
VTFGSQSGAEVAVSLQVQRLPATPTNLTVIMVAEHIAARIINRNLI